MRGSGRFYFSKMTTTSHRLFLQCAWFPPTGLCGVCVPPLPCGREPVTAPRNRLWGKWHYMASEAWCKIHSFYLAFSCGPVLGSQSPRYEGPGPHEGTTRRCGAIQLRAKPPSFPDMWRSKLSNASIPSCASLPAEAPDSTWQKQAVPGVPCLRMPDPQTLWT